MKSRFLRSLIVAFILTALWLPYAPASAQDTTPVPTQQDSPDRPLIVINSYYLDQDTIQPGSSFNLYLSIENQGALDAHNLIFTFGGDQFLPQETGGVVAVGSLGPGATKEIRQRMVASTALWGKTNGTVTVSLNYNGPSGEAFSEAFNITLDVLGWSGSWKTATPTPTITALPRAQMVISGYQTDVDPLQPGSVFNITMEIQNLGGGTAQATTMVLGGGSASSPTGPDTTPVPGGVSGAGADTSVFAPLESSNLQFLGDISPGATLTASQKLIVNVSASPGAYPLKISFIYNDAKGNQLIDDQVITLLVYQLPQVDVNFYRDPGPITAMNPNTLPIQVVNLGKKPTVLGNMTVSAENAELMNNVSLVGTLDAGGYFPLDVMLIPEVAGPMEIKIVINYTDDFNQARVIEDTIPIEVLEGAPMGPEGPGTGEPGVGPGMEGLPGGGIEPAPVEETLGQKVVRFLLGFFGLNSGPTQEQPAPGEMPPSEGEPAPVLPSGKG